MDNLLILNQNNTKSDSTKLILLTKVYRQYMKMRNFEKVDEYVDETIQLAQKLNLRRYSFNAYYRRGLFNHGFNKYQKAEENYFNAIKEATAWKNLNQVAGCYLSLGALYMEIPDYAKSLEMNQKALDLYQKYGDEGNVADCFTNIAEVYQDLHQQAKALDYLKKALKVYLKEGEKSRGTAVVHLSMGLAYFGASKEEQAKMEIPPNQRLTIALDYFNKSLKGAELIEDDGIVAESIKSIGDVYAEMGDKNLALKSYQKAIQISKTADNKINYSESLYALGDFYKKQKDYDNAVVLLANSIKVAEENKFFDNQKNSAYALSEAYEELGDFDRSLAYYKQYVEIKDQIFNQEKEKEITRQQMRIDFGVKERDYLFRQKITDGELQRQFLLAKQQQQQLKLRKQELAISDRDNDLQRINYLTKKHELENAKKLQKSDSISAQLQSIISNKKISTQEQQIKFDWKVKIFLTVGITLVLLTAVIIFFNQRKTTRLNKIINKQKRELEQLSRVKDRIFSVVSHDMRTPVNSLISFIQMLEEGNIEQDKLNRYAASLKNNLTYTSTMMENLLNWAASQMQGFNPYLEELNVQETTTEVINTLKQHALQKNISVNNHIEEGTFCKADSNMLSLVLRNLISNAIKFTPNEGSVTINAVTVNDELHINVSDTGVGMSPAQISHFNKPGYLGSGVSTLGTNKEKGTGLGLLLCRTFISLMDGEISVNADYKSGSQFVISLKQNKG
ncbi:tetratricopeptide repeat-containing sensor histidine kinase [Pedobacter sp. CCM 8938]|uniref:histidine kinase n=1 Tax=Pedobacter fastidiosus TaxID=2765361 RepID=A0ABR7KZC2_9SPHI|nr:tetratricopeptide repeat-containing sensor histidine kinase [Pedobacter fastidiosus]MBC6113063.1 tetratricopeptide repeat-containing sensor histidine kinase [Pedobacter fastidiosus]